MFNCHHIIKRIPIFLSLILISSCVFLTENRLSQTISDNSFLNRFPENQKAIIIFKLSGKKGEKIYLCDQKNINTGNIKNCQALYISNQYHILMLKPRLYYFLAPPINHPIFSNQIDQQLKYLTVLETRAGEISYIGDVAYKQSITRNENYDEDKNEPEILNQQFTVTDNFELVQKLLNRQNLKQTQKLFSNQQWEINYLTKEYPRLQNYFKKRLLQNSDSKPQKTIKLTS